VTRGSSAAGRPVGSNAPSTRRPPRSASKMGRRSQNRGKSYVERNRGYETVSRNPVRVVERPTGFEPAKLGKMPLGVAEISRHILSRHLASALSVPSIVVARLLPRFWQNRCQNFGRT